MIHSAALLANTLPSSNPTQFPNRPTLNDHLYTEMTGSFPGDHLKDAGLRGILSSGNRHLENARGWLESRSWVRDGVEATETMHACLLACVLACVPCLALPCLALPCLALPCNVCLLGCLLACRALAHLLMYLPSVCLLVAHCHVCSYVYACLYDCLPACSHVCLFACLPACLPLHTCLCVLAFACLLAVRLLACLFACMPCLLACLPVCLLACWSRRIPSQKYLSERPSETWRMTCLMTSSVAVRWGESDRIQS